MNDTRTKLAGGKGTTSIRGQYEKLVAAIGEKVKGKEDVIRLVVIAALAEGHVLIEDNPGTGKTLLARSFAQAINGEFKRIQFTPDLVPSDVIGARIYKTSNQEWEFENGPVFANMVLADEINRASPKTQSALLEAMQERQVTPAADETRKLPNPMIVLATQNPIEQHGTYPLPEAELDRFMIKIRIGYPRSVDDEIEVLRTTKDESPLEHVLEIEEFTQMIAAVREVHVSDAAHSYIARLVRATRDGRHDEIFVGVSPRGGKALVRACQALAAVDGASFVEADHARTLAKFVLPHRLVLSRNAARDEGAAERVIEAVAADEYETQTGEP